MANKLSRFFCARTRIDLVRKTLAWTPHPSGLSVRGIDVHILHPPVYPSAGGGRKGLCVDWFAKSQRGISITEDSIFFDKYI